MAPGSDCRSDWKLTPPSNTTLLYLEILGSGSNQARLRITISVRLQLLDSSKLSISASSLEILCHLSGGYCTRRGALVSNYYSNACGRFATADVNTKNCSEEPI